MHRRDYIPVNFIIHTRGATHWKTISSVHIAYNGCSFMKKNVNFKTNLSVTTLKWDITYTRSVKDGYLISFVQLFIHVNKFWKINYLFLFSHYPTEYPLTWWKSNFIIFPNTATTLFSKDNKWSLILLLPPIMVQLFSDHIFMVIDKRSRC